MTNTNPLSISGGENNDKFSYADVHGEWEERKIHILGPLKSFISHLRNGQDLTKVSLPSVLLRPYSMIEEFASRTLGHIPLLYKSVTQTEAQERMLTVVTWILSMTRDENFNHKPYNSVLGETHIARLTHSGTETYFFGEQVSHHPPITAFVIHNAELKITVTGTYSFNIKFAPNTIFVTTSGKCQIEIGSEIYLMDKSLPDMIIKNSLIGKKAVSWVGKISLSCPITSWHTEFDYHLSKDLVKYVDGACMCLERTKGAQCIYFGGRCSSFISKSLNEIKTGDKEVDEREIKATNSGYPGIGLLRSFIDATGLSSEPAKTEKKKSKGKHKKSKSVGNNESFDDILVDFTDDPELVPEYPALDKLPPNSSRIVWKELSKHIVRNEMEKADEVKQQIEEAQRQKAKDLLGAKETYTSPNFVYDEAAEIWRAKSDLFAKLPAFFE